MPDYRPINATTHFKCAFDVRLAQKGESDDPLMIRLCKKIRGWAMTKVPNHKDTLRGGWFFKGNPREEPMLVVDGVQIRTGIAWAGEDSKPAAWVFELIHRDTSEPNRRWSVDIALNQIDDDIVRFTTSNHHWMTPNYIGEYPEPPASGTPRFIRYILEDPTFECFRGSVTLNDQMEEVTHETAREIYDRLKDSRREVPFVFVTKRPDSAEYVVNPIQLHRYLLGNANVYLFPDDAVLAGMNYFLGDVFRIGNGSVRCFQSHFDKSRPDNSYIHRFFSPHNIAEKGEQWVVEAIANGFARNSNCFFPHDLKAFQDIHRIRRAAQVDRLRSLNKDSASVSTEDWEAFVEELEQLEQDKGELESLAKQRLIEIEDAEKQLGSMRYRIAEAEKLRQQFRNATDLQKTIEAFSELPSSLSAVLELASILFPDAIVVTQNAYKSATDFSARSQFWRKQESIAIAWNCIYSVAAILPKLIFEENSGDPTRLFEDQCGFEFTFTEGKQTNKDPRLVKLRQFDHDGVQYDMTPHVKCNKKKGEFLRLYFAIDKSNNRFIVNHFGDHLENFSTQKIS